jgi:hypothetical protein
MRISDQDILYDFLVWLRDEGWIKDDLLDQAPDITVADFVAGYQ